MGRPATLRVDIVADARGVDRGVAQAESKLGKLGSVGAKVGAAAAAGLAVAGVAAGKFALDSIAAASEVQQSLGALGTVYGKSADQVERWATRAADSVGLAKSEYANLSALVGSQLQGMGVEQGKSAKRSDELIRLGADLAATYGGSVSDAVGAVSSLLKGEADPIERYGVSIKQADVSARLAADGLDNLTGKAAKQAQAQATLSLLNEQTAKTTGAFAKESNTLAGQQQRLGARFENLKATLGQRLLPVATRVVKWTSDLLGGQSRLGNGLRSNLGPAFAAVGRFITGTAVPAARSIYGWFVDKIVPGIKRYLTPVLDGARGLFGKVADAVKRNEPELRTILGAIKAFAEFVANRVLPIIGKLIGNGFEVLGSVIGGVIDTISTLAGWIDTVVSKIGGLIDRIGDIKIPSIDIPGLAGQTFDMGVRLVGDAPSYDARRGWSSAATATPTLRQLQRTASSTGAGSVVVQQSVVVNVEGALDPDAVARQIEALLRNRQRRTGAMAATAW